MQITKLIETKKTVFNIEDLAKINNSLNRDYLKVLLVRMVKRKELIRIYKGIYTYTSDYNKLELANKLKKPSYVSLQRVLFDNGIIFQDFSSKITSVSNNTYSVKVESCEYSYFKIKDEILTNPIGLTIESAFRIATVERAICDTVYLFKNFYFDNIKNVDKEALLRISKIYNKRVKNEIEKYVRY